MIERIPQQTRPWLAAMLAGLAALAVAWLGWALGGPVALDIGAPTDVSFVRGFYAAEQSNHGTYRWSSPTAQIWLPAVRGPAQLQLRMVGRPGGSTMTVRAGDVALATFDVPSGPARRYRVLLDTPPPPGGGLTIGLGGDGAALGDDPRAVVALVEAVALAPADSAAALPPALPLLLLALAGPLAYALLALAGAGRAALPLAIAASAALAIGWAFGRVWVAPYLPASVLGLALISGVVGAVRAGLHRAGALGPADLFALFAAAAAFIPLYLYVSSGWDTWLHWHNLPVLLLPLGVALAWVRGRVRVALAVAALLAAGGYGAGMAIGALSGDYARDFYALFSGVRRLLINGQPLYLLDEIRANPLGQTYKYPPMFALLMAPITPLRFVPAFMVWKFANLAMLTASAVLLFRMYRVRLRSWAGAGMLLVLLSLRPLTDTLGYGQVDLIVLLLLTLGLLAVRRRRDVFLGVWLGIATALKLYPAYLLGFALLRRRPRALLGAAIGGGALTLASLLWLGWPVHATFLRDVLALTGVGTAWVENQTFNGFINRLLSPEQVSLLPDGGGALRLATYACALAFTALTAWLTRPAGRMRADVAYGMWIIAMLLIIPAAWMHYEALLLIPFCQAFVLARDAERPLRWPAAVAYALAWLLLAHGNLWTFFDKSLHGPYWQLILSYKFYGMLMLYGAIVLANAGEPATAAARADWQPEALGPASAPAL